MRCSRLCRHQYQQDGSVPHSLSPLADVQCLARPTEDAMAVDLFAEIGHLLCGLRTRSIVRCCTTFQSKKGVQAGVPLSLFRKDGAEALSPKPYPDRIDSGKRRWRWFQVKYQDIEGAEALVVERRLGAALGQLKSVMSGTTLLK